MRALSNKGSSTLETAYIGLNEDLPKNDFSGPRRQTNMKESRSRYERLEILVNNILRSYRMLF